ncbi:uncharacterized protein LOC118268450 [Spodoptera frugiperda]|uniref:Uncharacterized protein LOC118268450 n=1 Tax=Spodoptera frugiperda TaxID=7108 RepID=A0A9R0F4K9_SPOFR|nr:uncharacterized protein LOC118268450 [Spodoptera frugiperda]
MKVSEGFLVADSRNLPKVDYIMLLQYMHENDCYNIAETRSAKALLASREAYVDTAVGYVEVKRDGNLCTVKCRVTPEHKVKARLYQVTAVIDESLEKIITVECNDCVASAGGCKHAICFTMWLIKRSDEPSTTSTHCYWTKPKLAGAVSHQNFILAKNIGKKKRTPDNVDMTVSIGMFSEECKKRKVVTGMILNYCGNQQPQLNDCSVFNLVLQFIHQVDDHCYNNFKSFSASKLTVDVLESIAEATKSQADSKLWHSMRQGRVTGSKIYEAIHCKTENGALVQSILGGYKVPETKAIRRGKVLEKEVVKELEKEFGAIQHTGLILISPIIGVSPDGICSDFVIEIKCPISENTIKNYVRDGILGEKYKAQIMVQMHAAKKLKGLFCIADPTFEQTKLLHKYWVDYDKKYVTGLLDRAEEFWKQFIFKTVLQSAK